MIRRSRVDGESWALRVIEEFIVDRNLPKYNLGKKNDEEEGAVNENVMSFSNWNVRDDDNSEPPEKGDSVGKVGWRRRFANWVEKTLGLKEKSAAKKAHTGTVDPLRVLLSVSSSLEPIKAYEKRMTVFDEVIVQARKTGQVARVEQLEKARSIVQFESVLMSTGFKQYLPEDKAVEFYQKCEKGLRLDWVANFTRPIPPEVIEKKIEADKLMIFDNYVVMHYDPGKQAYALTEAQKEAKKDPILFGVIKDVRKLYFIGEWKDDVCQLTMDDIKQVLGESFEIEDDPTKEM